jgi:hypothetical protein
MANDILNLDLSATKGTTIQVNGDPNSQFTLNLSDFGIYDRLTDGLNQLYDVFVDLKDKVGDVAETQEPENTEEGTEEDATKFIELMKEADGKMRGIVDYIFSAPVSNVCAPDGYMFDIFEGQLRFEYIINAITKLYENNINKEFYNIKSRINSKLPKYAKKGH